MDPFFCMFVIDTNSKHLSNGNFFEIANLPFFYPKKQTLGFSDPLIFHSLLFALIKPFVSSKATAIRLMFVLFFFLNWLVCSKFLFLLKKNVSISIFVGWLFTFSLFFQVQSAHYQNLLVFPIFLSILPLFSPEMKLKYKFIYSFIGISIFLISNLYFSIYSLIVYFSSLIFLYIYKGSITLKKNVYSILGVLISLMVCYPLLQFYFDIRIEYPEIVGVRNFEEKIQFSASWRDYLKVLYPPSIYLHFKKYFVSFDFEKSNFSGLIGLILFFAITVSNIKNIFKRKYDIYKLSIFLFGIGVFLASGAIYLPFLYKIILKIVPGISEIRALGRAGLIINLGIILSVYYFLIKFPIKNTKQKLFFSLICLLLFSERFAEDFYIRNIEYSTDSNREAKLIFDSYIILNKVNKTKPILVISENSENNIRIPFFLNLESDATIINGYSGYQPKEWNHFALLNETNAKCDVSMKKNEFLFSYASLLLVETNSLFYKKCKLEIERGFKLSIRSQNFNLYDKLI
ncbi:MAG: hypothetical protein SH817_12555 [Leptospira sp.]|nr:hypothetical protein [Leptospira sp.]